MANPNDRRVRKTKKLMTDALAKLLSEKPLKNITVREIADEADINRGTFYLHYKDVFDMVEKIQDEIFDKFNTIIIEYMPTSGSETLFPFLEKLFELLSENASLARVLVGHNGDAAFINKLKNVVRNKLLSQAAASSEIRKEFDFLYSFISSGCIGLCHEWLDGDMSESPSEIASLTEKFIIGSYNALKSKTISA